MLRSNLFGSDNIFVLGLYYSPLQQVCQSPKLLI